MAIIDGDAGNNNLIGTALADELDGKAGNDTSTGGAGDDIYKFGGSFGADEVREGAGGGDGNDLIRILPGIPASAVRLVGNSSDDLYIIADGFGTIRLADHLLTADVERLQIGAGPIISLAGGLNMTGSALADAIYGTAFNDTITGGDGSDDLIGRGGDDTYRFGGSFGTDEVFEGVGGGNDLLQILAGIPASAVRLVGNSSDDLYIVADGFGSIRLADHLLTADVERLQIGAGPIISLAGGLNMTGSALADAIYGTAFGDTITGGDGSDDLIGRGGNDIYQFTGFFGQDEIFDASGLNELVFTDLAASQVTQSNASGDLLIRVNGRSDEVRIDDYFTDNLAGNFVIKFAAGTVGTAGDDALIGSLVGDSIRGLGGNDFIRGLGGNDTLLGEAGNDTILGDLGADVVNGGAGNDRLVGGAGKDTAIGGLGRDRFVFDNYAHLGNGATRDVVSDFNKAQLDRIDLSDLDAQPGVAGEQSFVFIGGAAFGVGTPGQVRFSSSGGVTLVELNTDADADAEYQIELTGTIALTAADFFL